MGHQLSVGAKDLDVLAIERLICGHNEVTTQWIG